MSVFSFSCYKIDKNKMNKHISPNKKIVNDGLVQIIALVAMVTCVQKKTSIASL